LSFGPVWERHTVAREAKERHMIARTVPRSHLLLHGAVPAEPPFLYKMAP
jgi:hypothetical protein